MDKKYEKAFKRGKIIGMWQMGATKSRISREVGVDRNTVSKWITRYEEEGHAAPRKQTGQKRKTTPEEDQKIAEYVKAHPKTNLAIIKKDLNITASEATIGRRLRKMGHERKKSAKGKKQEQKLVSKPQTTVPITVPVISSNITVASGNNPVAVPITMPIPVPVTMPITVPVTMPLSVPVDMKLDAPVNNQQMPHGYYHFVPPPEKQYNPPAINFYQNMY